MVVAQKPMERVFSIFTEMIGKNVDMREYVHRLIVQKLTFLIQGHLSKIYPYSWYIRGPYSPVVSEEAFELFENGNIIFEMNKTDANILLELKKLLNSDSSEQGVDDRLELCASIAFLKKQKELANENEIIEKLHSLKPWFSAEKIRSALEKLKKSSFL